MGEYLIDNNIISKFFSQEFTKKGMDLVSGIFDKTPNISVITQIEALSWKSQDKKKEAIVKSFIEDANVIHLSNQIVKECIKLRISKKIRTPDAIIAATALVYNLTLATTDKDFSNINNLEVINPNNM